MKRYTLSLRTVWFPSIEMSYLVPVVVVRRHVGRGGIREPVDLEIETSRNGRPISFASQMLREARERRTP